jgi:hypothetical protein
MTSEGLAPMPTSSDSPARTWPWVGGSTPANSAVKVDLPAPLGPMTATHSPARTSALTLSNACTMTAGRFADMTDTRGRRVTETDSTDTST